jgi:hypothetical protein
VALLPGETWGAQLSGKLGGIDVAVARRREDLVRSFAAKEPDPLDELCQSLFARITETAISHATEDWTRYYDKVRVLVCRVVNQSDLNIAAKAVLTHRLINHIVELEKWWPRLKPEHISRQQHGNEHRSMT